MTFLLCLPPTRVGNFRQKNNSSENGIDGTTGYFRRNSGCSVKQKALGIPFPTLPRKKKQLGNSFRWTKIEAGFPSRTLQQKRNQLGIPFRGTKIEANSRSSLPNSSPEEKKLGILFSGTKIEANSTNSVPNHFAEDKPLRVECRGRQSDQRNRSESIPRNFSATKFHFQPYLLLHRELIVLEQSVPHIERPL